MSPAGFDGVDMDGGKFGHGLYCTGYVWILEKETAQPFRSAYRLRRSWDLPGDLAQVDRMALINSYQQPDKVPHLGDPLFGSQFTNLVHPSMIESVDRHWVTPFIK